MSDDVGIGPIIGAFSCGIVIWTAFMAGCGMLPSDVRARAYSELAQAHCEQQGFALGRYEQDRITCYQREGEVK